MIAKRIWTLLFALTLYHGHARGGQPCLGPAAPQGSSGLVRVPLHQLIRCLEGINIETDYARQTVQNLDKVFEVGYAFYYLARNITDSNYLNEYGQKVANENPYNWQLYKGETEGRVRSRVCI